MSNASKPAGALLLDLDGTLVDSTPFWVEAYLASFASYGITMTREEFLDRIFHVGGSLPSVMAEHGLDEHITAFRAARDERYVALLRERIEWLPGAKTMLRGAGEAARIGIVTNSWRAYVDAIDARLCVSDHVGCILALEDQGASWKPAPDGLFAAAARLKADPARCVYVGDHANDMVAARAAGMQAWLVPVEETRPEAADLADRVFKDRGEVGAAWTAISSA